MRGHLDVCSFLPCVVHAICVPVKGVPLKPMLAKPTKGISEVLDRFSEQEFTCEYKYDGERAQIHCLEDGTFRIYSRNSENHTGKYPDLIEALPGVCLPGTGSFIFDSEVVAWDRDTGEILPFQRLSTRARKVTFHPAVKGMALAPPDSI